MKKLITFTILAYSCTLFAQNVKPFKNSNGKYGFINTKNDTVIQAQFDDVKMYNFSEYSPLAIVVRDKKVGIVNLTGQICLEPIYDNISMYSEKALVQKDGLLGLFVNEKGLTIPIAYTNIKLDQKTKRAICSQQNKMGVFDFLGNQVLPLNFDNITLDANNVLLIAQKDNLTGAFDINGKEKIPFKYSQIAPSSSNKKGRFLMLAAKDNKFGYIDATGKTVIPFIYNEASTFFSDIAEVNMNDKWGYINTQGKTIIPFIYDEADFFENERAFVGKLNTDNVIKYALIDKKGNELTPFKYDYYDSFLYDENLSIVQEDSCAGVINRSGKEIVCLDYNVDSILLDNEFNTERYIILYKNGKVILADYNGDIIVPNFYEDIDLYTLYEEHPSDYILTQNKGKKGVWNVQTRSEVISPSFDNIYNIEDIDFQKNIYLSVANDNLWGIWDLQSNKIIVPCEYPEPYFTYFYSHNGIVKYILATGTKTALYDNLGNCLVKTNTPQSNSQIINSKIAYNFIEPSYYLTKDHASLNSYLVTEHHEYGNYSIYNLNGNVVFDTIQFASLKILTDNGTDYLIIQSPNTERYGVYSSDGKELLPQEYNEITAIKNAYAYQKVSKNKTALINTKLIH